MNTLRDLKKAGKTVLIVHHDLSKVPHYFDQVLLVNREWISFGPTKETFTEANLKEAYGNRLFSMEVTYDCRIYRWIAKFHFLQNALIQPLSSGRSWSCRMFHHPYAGCHSWEMPFHMLSYQV